LFWITRRATCACCADGAELSRRRIEHAPPTLGLNTLRWAKKQGAITGPAHSGSGLAPSGERVAGEDGPGGLPNYAIPQYNGIGANEYVVDITHEVPGPAGKPVPAIDFISTMDPNRQQELNMWYHTLNCGFRAGQRRDRLSCISGQRVGMGQVYVKVAGKLNYEDYCEGIARGRSYVSDGTTHLMEFVAASADGAKQSVPVGTGDSELKLAGPGKLRLTAKVAARLNSDKPAAVEAIVNGYPVARQEIATDGTTQDISLEVPVERSSWVALRLYPSAHTNPVFVLVDGQPIRASKRSAEWCLRGVDQCWKEKRPMPLLSRKKRPNLRPCSRGLSKDPQESEVN
jgi:hypothetical protein